MMTVTPAPGAPLSHAALDAPRFPDEQCERLYAAVAEDDEINLEASLLEPPQLKFSQDQIVEAFRLCRQMLLDGAERPVLIAIANRLIQGQVLSAEERAAYKVIRAKFKHMRYAFVNFDSRHKIPLYLNRTTITMGVLQDAFKNGQRLRSVRKALYLRFFLSRPVYARMLAELDHYSPATPNSLFGHIAGQVERLQRHVNDEEIVAKSFHGLRKIIGCQVALFDTLRTLENTPYLFAMSRFLATINGMSGDAHDLMVEMHLAGKLDYKGEMIAFPQAIRIRMQALVAHVARAAA